MQWRLTKGPAPRALARTAQAARGIRRTSSLPPRLRSLWEDTYLDDRTRSCCAPSSTGSALRTRPAWPPSRPRGSGSDRRQPRPPACAAGRGLLTGPPRGGYTGSGGDRRRAQPGSKRSREPARHARAEVVLREGMPAEVVLREGLKRLVASRIEEHNGIIEGLKEKYGASGHLELEDKIRKGEMPEHPAWEDVISMRDDSTASRRTNGPMRR